MSTGSFKLSNIKGADQTALVRRLVCAYIGRKQQSEGFWHRGPYDVEAQTPAIFSTSDLHTLKPGTFVCNSVLQTKISWCVRPRNMFQEIFYGS